MSERVKQLLSISKGHPSIHTNYHRISKGGYKYQNKGGPNNKFTMCDNLPLKYILLIQLLQQHTQTLATGVNISMEVLTFQVQPLHKTRDSYISHGWNSLWSTNLK